MRSFILLLLCTLVSCTSNVRENKSGIGGSAQTHKADPPNTPPDEVRVKPQIPILCYHNIHQLHRNNSPALTVTDSVFTQQMKSLYDSGYHTISPDQLYQYLTTGAALPPKPLSVAATFPPDSLTVFAATAVHHLLPHHRSPCWHLLPR